MQAKYNTTTSGSTDRTATVAVTAAAATEASTSKNSCFVNCEEAVLQMLLLPISCTTWPMDMMSMVTAQALMVSYSKQTAGGFQIAIID